MRLKLGSRSASIVDRAVVLDQNVGRLLRGTQLLHSRKEHLGAVNASKRTHYNRLYLSGKANHVKNNPVSF